ncbi:aldehyde dehydrogenase family protein [Candidatus Woesearchaeota archaeon]|nr:aldehyde dehydrogenase family protein [Candidatus Woesearchaeota archaeon]
MAQAYLNYIGGQWVPSSSGQTFESRNPANPADSLGSFQKSTPKDMKEAIDAAERAYPDWSRMPPPKRGEILLKAAELLRQNKHRLGQLVTREMGKQIKEGLGDVQEAIDIAEYVAGEGRRLYGHTTTSELPDKFCMTIRRPVGIAGLITPWNFPIAIPAWKLLMALICGNSVVLKPSSDTPLCAIELVKILDQAGVPKGVVNLVAGSGSELGDALVMDPRVRVVSFTGSKAVAEHVIRSAGLKKVGIESGGKNAIIVMDDADLLLAVDGVVWGAFGTTGQRCTACSRVIIHQKVQKAFEKMLLDRLRKLKVGDGMACDVGPLVNQQALDKVAKYVEIGKSQGAKLLCGGRPIKKAGYFFELTVFTNVKPSMRIAQEEIFGPVLSIIPVVSFEEAVRVCNNTEYGLSSAIYTADINKAFKAMEHIETGITYLNSSTIGAEVHLPFGGVKGTGNGTREAGIEGIHEFSETKTVYVDYSGKLQKAQIDTVEAKRMAGHAGSKKRVKR